MKRYFLLACLVLLLLVVPAVPASPTISYVSPESWPDYGIIHLTIHGTGFDNVNQVRLNKCKMLTGGVSSEAPFSGTITGRSSTAITADFDLTGKKIGQYSVSVNDPTTLVGEDWGYKDFAFTIYSHSGSTPTATTTTSTATETTETETTVTSGQGENSVFFESNPTGAEVWLEGEDIGTTAFTWYTNRDGTYDVVVKKIGYEDYEAKVTVIEGKRVHFSAVLTELSETSGNTTKTTKTTTTGKPATNITTIQKSTLKVPTPWGPDPTFTEESPADPAIALLAAVFGFGFLVMRRR
jgi:hypothetical protein